MKKYFKWFNCSRCSKKSRISYNSEAEIPDPLCCYGCQNELHVPKYRVKRGAKKKIDAELFKKLYYEDKKSLAEIGRMFEVSRVAIYKIAKGLDISIRNKTQARALAQKGGKLPYGYYEIDEGFFSIWNPQMAYVLGFIYADGNIASTKTKSGEYCYLQLFINEKDHIEKIATMMKSEYPIHKIVTSKQILYGLSISRRQIVNDLLKLGLTPRKSLTITFPDMPYAFLKHFIRGVFDGDGTASSGRFRIVSGSKYFASKLRENLIRLLEVEPRRVQLYTESYAKNPAYLVAVCQKASLLKLYHQLYDNVSNVEYLERKKQSYKKILQQKGIEV